MRNAKPSKIYSYMLIGLTLGGSVAIHAEEMQPLPVLLKDPTKPQDYTSKIVKDLVNPENKEEKLYLSAIIIDNERKLAVINGKILREGDVIGPSKIKEIQETSVLLGVPGLENTKQDLVMRLPNINVKSKEEK